MLNQVVQGDNGTVFALKITDNNGAVDITQANIETLIQYKDTVISKPVTIIDGPQGKCEFVLKSQDVEQKGAYTFQVVVEFNNGNKFSSNIHQFTVSRKIQK